MLVTRVGGERLLVGTERKEKLDSMLPRSSVSWERSMDGTFSDVTNSRSLLRTDEASRIRPSTNFTKSSGVMPDFANSWATVDVDILEEV